jgi:hypothetical protein
MAAVIFDLLESVVINFGVLESTVAPEVSMREKSIRWSG